MPILSRKVEREYLPLPLIMNSQVFPWKTQHEPVPLLKLSRLHFPDPYFPVSFQLELSFLHLDFLIAPLH